MHPNLKAFLDTIAISEGTSSHLLTLDRGYDVIVTGVDELGKTTSEIFRDYSTHPFTFRRAKLVNAAKGLYSSAAGRYQLLYRYYGPYCHMLGLKDFTPDSQDKIALQQIKERHAINDILTGHFQVAVGKVSNIWASLPGAGFGQHENKMAHLEDAYDRAGGTFA